MLEVKSISCVKGPNRLFFDFNLCVKPGDLIKVGGINGSGKTSLLRILCGLSLPDKGIITWKGVDIQSNKLVFNSSLAYIGHSNGIKLELNPLENLEFTAKLFHPVSSKRIIQVLQQMRLTQISALPCGNLSAGQRRSVALARLLIFAADLWILDEPFTAIDDEGVTIIEEIMKDHLENGGMIIFTSHRPLKLLADQQRVVEIIK